MFCSPPYVASTSVLRQAPTAPVLRVFNLIDAPANAEHYSSVAKIIMTKEQWPAANCRG